MTTFSQPFAYRSLCTLSAAVALASLAACGGGNDSSPAPAPAPVTPPPPAVSTTVSGAVVKGPVTGAQVCAFTVVGSARGTALGSCTTTDASGNYSFAVPAGTGPLWVEATGGSYTDEVTGATVSVPAGSPLVSLVTANGAAVSTMLTPLTTLALNAARSTAGASGTLDAASYSAAAAQLLSSFNLPSNLNITTTLPAFGAGINSYGTALTTISQMVANGTTLAAILANSNPGALAAAFAAAASPPPVGGGGGGGGGTGPPSASGTLTVSGLASFTPQSTGFQVSLSSASSLRAGYRFFVETQRTVGNATVTDRRELKIDPLTGGGYSVALFDSATREQNLCFSNCAVTFSTPSGASHPVQVSFSNLALSGNRTLNGTLTGDAPGAAWTVADLPGGSTSSLTLNGAAVSVLGSSDSTLDTGGGNTLRAISLRLSDGSTVSLQRNGGAAITVDRVLPPASLAACATACNVSLADGSGTRVTFANTPLSGGLVLNGTVDYARTSGSLTSSDLGGFTPAASSIESLNSARILTFNVLGTAAQAGLSLVTVEVAAGRVTRAQATVGIATQVLSCFDNGTAIGIPACAGVTVAADGRTVTFNNAVLRGGAVGAAARNVTFNGTVAAKGP
jgi:hypothetical protein